MGELVLEGKIERRREGRYEKFWAMPPKRTEVITDRELSWTARGSPTTVKKKLITFIR